MKKALLVLALVSAGLVHAQTWKFSSGGSVSTKANLNAVNFPPGQSSSPGYIVGDSGKVLRGGQVFLVKSSKSQLLYWDARNSGTTEILYGAHSNIFVGAKGKVLTQGSGVEWVNRTAGDSVDLFAVHAPTATTAYAVGVNGTILKTTNGGAVWMKQTSGTTQPLYAVHFVDTARGWAVGQSGTVLKTTNGGTAWVSQGPTPFASYYGVHFISSSTGWVVGAGGTIRKTTDGGGTWPTQTSGTSQTLRAVHFAMAQFPGGDTLIGSAVGDAGTIVSTSNGGTTWTLETTASSRDLNAVHVFGSWYRAQAVAVGDSGTILVRAEVTGGIHALGDAFGGGRASFSSGTLRYQLGRPGTVDFALLALDGRTLWSTASARLPAGEHRINLPAKLPSGIVFARLGIDGDHTVARLFLP